MAFIKVNIQLACTAAPTFHLVELQDIDEFVFRHEALSANVCTYGVSVTEVQ